MSITPQMQPANFLNLLIVDDERSIREACREVAQSLGFSVYVADSAEHAYRLLETQTFDAVLLDLRLPGAGGLEALRRIKERRPEAVVIVVTGYGTVQSAVQAMKNGAYDYVTKPFSVDELKLLLERVASHLKLKSENRLLREKVKSKQGFGGIVGRAPEMEKLYRIIAKAANSVHPVLILGESGTGKELVAKTIHSTSPRADRPFVPVNTGSMPVDLLESTLFGHVKGAFTSAIATKRGLFEVADQGTIFFDEIGTIGPETQIKLLRVIQEKEFTPLGATDPIKVDVRILAATNADLRKLVQENKFREDLYYRLNVINIPLPPLRDRKEDIPLLVEHFLKKYSAENGRNGLHFSPEAMKMLMDYDWPGNVRELENAIERAVVLSSAPALGPDLLPEQFFENHSAASHGFSVENTDGRSLFEIMETCERQIILDMLERSGWSQTEAAERFKIPLSTLNQKIKRLQIDIKRRNLSTG
jgi:DNA-binding NtrC family response regulator